MRPNIVLVVADDHAAHAISAYGGEHMKTPHLDRVAAEGMRFDACYCTNSLCAPSRASILTGTYSHVNQVRTLWTLFDARQPTFASMLHEAGYQTAIVGKWHLGHGGGHDPHRFDHWDVLEDQGDYWDPELLSATGRRQVAGYTTTVLTDLAIQRIQERDRSRPFCLLLHHKAPHRSWDPDTVHVELFAGVDLPVPEGLDETGRTRWAYQRYIKDYLRCVASIDDNLGRLLAVLDDEGLAEDTVLVYTSDQGFFLGDHGWYDKRFMYEESLRMPLLVRYPREVPAGSVIDALALNVDFAQTFLDFAGLEPHPGMQGRSLRPLLRGERPAGWPTTMYYRYWEHDDVSHHVPAHYGIRTDRYKLVYYYGDGLGVPGASGRPTPPEWELFDLRDDPAELRNVYHDPAYATVRAELTAELDRLQRSLGDTPYESSTAEGGSHS